VKHCHIRYKGTELQLDVKPADESYSV
jgi:hypothetical protein